MVCLVHMLFYFLPFACIAFEPIRSHNDRRTDRRTDRRQTRDSARFRDRDYDDDDAQEEENIIPFTIEHSFGNDNWSKRGDVNLMFNSVSKRVGKVNFLEVAITPEHVEKLQRVIAEDSYYRVRLVPRENDSSSAGKYVMAAVKGCALSSSDFREMFNFHSDIYGSIISLGYKTSTNNCLKNPKPISEKYFRAKGKITVATPGKSPYVVKSDFYSSQKPKPEEKGIFQKYWLYFVAAGITWFLISAVGGEGGGGGGGGGGGS